MGLGKINFRDNRKRKTVFIPELEDSFTLSALTVGQMKKLKEGDEDNIPRQLAMAIVDPETGACVYDVDNPEDIEMLNAMPLSIFSPLIDALNEINGRGQDTIEQAKKKSNLTPFSVSASA